jgi:hypothetical protein
MRGTERQHAEWTLVGGLKLGYLPQGLAPQEGHVRIQNQDQTRSAAQLGLGLKERVGRASAISLDSETRRIAKNFRCRLRLGARADHNHGLMTGGLAGRPSGPHEKRDSTQKVKNFGSLRAHSCPEAGCEDHSVTGRRGH